MITLLNHKVVSPTEEDKENSMESNSPKRSKKLFENDPEMNSFHEKLEEDLSEISLLQAKRKMKY